jgi:cellulose synthase (UDP-forming)
MALVEEGVAQRSPVRTNVAAWSEQLGVPKPESERSRRLAHIGGLAAATALAAYVTWRIAFTLPTGPDLIAALLLVAFETIPLFRLVYKTSSLWRIDSPSPSRLRIPDGLRVAVLIPTYDEPVEVVAPTIAAACALQPDHETWVLDDGERTWLAELCESFGARYVSRQVHDHDKAGNLNYALAVLSAEDAAGIGGADVVAVLDCDHVPLPPFLTSTLGWFADEKVALVQAPQVFYNAGAFDDDGMTGEQGVFFNVTMPASQRSGADIRWCGSTALLRVDALSEIGGFAAGTVREDLHTTIELLGTGWRSIYQHQTLALGLAPATPSAYLVQQRRRALGAMQVLAQHRLWSPQRVPGLSRVNRWALLSAAGQGLAGLATLLAFVVPVLALLSGAVTSTAHPLVFIPAFVAMWAVRLWGARLLLRRQIQWRTHLALSILRIPVGLACLRWLLRRDRVRFDVTPKAGSHTRARGRIPTSILLSAVFLTCLVAWSLLGMANVLPWHADTSSTVAADAWLVAGLAVLALGARRIRSAHFATTRRNAHRVPVSTPVTVSGVTAELDNISIGGAAVRFPSGTMPAVEIVELGLPMAEPIRMVMTPLPHRTDDYEFAALRYLGSDWRALQTMSLWMFHTPYDAVPSLPAGTPVVAAR